MFLVQLFLGAGLSLCEADQQTLAIQRSADMRTEADQQISRPSSAMLMTHLAISSTRSNKFGGGGEAFLINLENTEY